MADLTTKYLGLTLKNPVIAGSSGLTGSVDTIKELEKYGASAIVLKSIFEEEITMEYELLSAEAEKQGMNRENLDYFDMKIKADNVGKYLKLIEHAKTETSIPIIASINCVSSFEWTNFTKKCQDAGADAIELNIFLSPADMSKTATETENVYFDIISKVRSIITIPLAVKISYHFTKLGFMIQKISESGIEGIVLFNRFFTPDFDINKMEVISSNVLSKVQDLGISLRWVALASPKVKCDIAASTGIHDGKAVIKQLLAGANVVQVASALYQNGTEFISEIIKEVESWMNEKGYSNIEDFRGKMNQSNVTEPGIFERVQFMKYFREKET